VGYDALAESVHLIESGFETDPARLSRRRRFAPVAFDVQGDLAATWFVRRGAGTFWHEVHTLERRNGSWVRLGGGGYSSDEDELADRPPAAELSGPLQVSAGGATALRSGSWLPRPIDSCDAPGCALLGRWSRSISGAGSRYRFRGTGAS
jgi:hypothetical protein